MYLHLIIALVVAASTWIAGWWIVAIVALLAGFLLRRQGGRAWHVALGSAEGWAVLLIVDAAGRRSSELLSMLGGTVHIPGVSLLIATLLFPALIGWSGAALAAEIGQMPLFTRTN